MKIENRRIELVYPYDKNPRINDGAVDAVAKSIEHFGFRQPIVVDRNGVIIIGHTRLKAAKRLGLKTVPVHVADGLSDDQIRALRIADNKTGELAEWDMELLPIEMESLRAIDFDLGLLGFDDVELSKIADAGGIKEGNINPDDIPLPPDEAKTKRGDLWILGRHRLMCGDSSVPAELDRLIEGNPIHLVNTDPPYNVKVEPRSNNAVMSGLSNPLTNSPDAVRLRQRRGNAASFNVDHDTGNPKGKATHKKMRAKDRHLTNDFISESEFDQLLSKWFSNISKALVPGGVFYIWGGNANCANYPKSLKENGLYFSQLIIWDKQSPVLTRKDFLGVQELAFYGWKEGAGHKFYGPKNITDLWSVKKLNHSVMVHLTEKPVELALRAMQYSSLVGENVLDIFGGSGSTLIAAEQADRNAFLMELDPLYCDVIVDRFEKFTGQKAKLWNDESQPKVAQPKRKKARTA